MKAHSPDRAAGEKSETALYNCNGIAIIVVIMKAIVVLLLLFANVLAAEEPSLTAFERKPYVLSEAEVESIKNEIRTRCNLAPADDITYPWYYHYELGLAMQKHRDWQRALDSMLTALDRRERPQKFTRIYGMWFIDYFPYYNIGLAHYNLNNWKCAVQSFRLSQMFEDIPRDAVQSYRLRELELEAQKRLQPITP